MIPLYLPRIIKKADGIRAQLLLVGEQRDVGVERFGDFLCTTATIPDFLSSIVITDEMRCF